MQFERRRIALLIPSLSGGGAERVFVRLASYFSDAGHQVDMVLMTTANLTYMDELSAAVRVVDLKVSRLWQSSMPFHRYLQLEKPDVVIAAMPLANGIAAWAKITSGTKAKVFLTEHNALSLAFGDVDVPRYRPLVWAIRPSYRFADGIVAVSRGVAERVLKMPGVGPGKVHVIHNPCWTVDMSARASEPVDHPWFKDGGAPIILSVGRLEEQKDFPTLINAFGILRQTRAARLVVLGKGSLHAALQAQVDAADLTSYVSLPGFVANPFSYMRRASMFVLSSFQEGFGNVLVEAMACGTPVVSTISPGPRDILDDGRYGPMVAVGDAAALAQAMEKMMDSPTPTDLLKKRARDFSVDAAGESYLRIMGLSDSRRASDADVGA